MKIEESFQGIQQRKIEQREDEKEKREAELVKVKMNTEAVFARKLTDEPVKITPPDAVKEEKKEEKEPELELV